MPIARQRDAVEEAAPVAADRAGVVRVGAGCDQVDRLTGDVAETERPARLRTRSKPIRSPRRLRLQLWDRRYR